MHAGPRRASQLPFTDLVKKAYRFSQDQPKRQLAYLQETPGISWDKEKGKGDPFYYFAISVSFRRVEVDILQAASACCVWISLTICSSLNPGIRPGSGVALSRAGVDPLRKEYQNTES